MTHSAPLATSATPSISSLRALREAFVLGACALFVLSALLTGPMRWGLTSIGLAPLIYLPNLLLMAATAWQFLGEAFEEGVSPLRVIAVVVLAHALVIGLLQLPTVQVGFGIYTLLPFWFGLSCAPLLFRRWSLICAAAPWLWALAAGGVFLNAFSDLPWEGFGYSVGDLDIEASREWQQIGGGKRLAGLARSSFDAAAQIQIMAIVAVLGLRSISARLGLWILSAVAIWLTTSKGVFNVFLVLTPVVILRDRLPQVLARPLPLGFGLLGLLLPISPLLYSFHSKINDPFLANLTFSFYDRLTTMWPEAWALIHHIGNPVFGRGLGGIGTAQSYFEPALFNAGDNLFMYWFVTFGWVALPGFFLLLVRSLRLRPFRSPSECAVFCLVLATLVYGMTTNVVENGMFAIICGISVRFLAAPFPLSSLTPVQSHA